MQSFVVLLVCKSVVRSTLKKNIDNFVKKERKKSQRVYNPIKLQELHSIVIIKILHY